MLPQHGIHINSNSCNQLNLVQGLQFNQYFSIVYPLFNIHTYIILVLLVSTYYINI